METIIYFGIGALIATGLEFIVQWYINKNLNKISKKITYSIEEYIANILINEGFNKEEAFPEYLINAETWNHEED